jgi:hypothetical protein
MNLSHVFRRFATELAYDDHTNAHYDVTAGQLSFAFIWAWCTFLWLFRYAGKPHREPNGNDDAVTRKESNSNGSVKADNEKVKQQQTSVVDIEKSGKNVDTNKVKSVENEKENCVKTFSSVRPPPPLDVFLKHVCIFGLLLFFFYLCDYRKVCYLRF